MSASPYLLDEIAAAKVENRGETNAQAGGGAPGETRAAVAVELVNVDEEVEEVNVLAAHHTTWDKYHSG